MHGLKKVVREEKNAQRILAITVLVIGAGLFLRLNAVEFAVVCICCGCVFVAEVFNTLFENTLDIVRPHHCDTIKILKDMSSGAVLVASMISFVCGVLIFLPKVAAMMGFHS